MPSPPFLNSELVLGLVAPVGTHLDRFISILKGELSRFNYKLREVKLSDLVRNFKLKTTLIDQPEEERLHSFMDAGNELRRTTQLGEVLALAGAHAISQGRERDDGSKPPHRLPNLGRVAHVFRSLKHPEEVLALRRIYGPGFFLLGVVASPEERRRHLIYDRGCTSAGVDGLFGRDEDEGEVMGQRTRDTFALADAFVPFDDVKAIQRIVELIFGCPFHTPFLDEHAMFMAFSASLRSGDLSRQVGAVVVSSLGNVIGIGANDVPRPGGGLYWPGSDDQRDLKLGYDANERQRSDIAKEIVSRLFKSDQKRKDALERLEATRLSDITEYGRAVHAEMEALISCARSGSSPVGGTLFSTTFPCHNCAKHIVAAGVHEVVFVEPYPKSQALTLHSDSMVLGVTHDGRTSLRPFSGIGPRRFLDLFSLGLSSGYAIKRKDKGKRKQWSPERTELRVPMYPNSYLDRELGASEQLVAITTEPGTEESHGRKKEGHTKPRGSRK